MVVHHLNVLLDGYRSPGGEVCRLVCSLIPYSRGFHHLSVRTDFECYDYAHCGISLNIVRVSSLDTAELKMCTSLS